MLGKSIINTPNGCPYNDDGSIKFLPANDGIASNPLAEFVPGYFQRTKDNLQDFSPMYLQVDLAENLRFTSTFGPDLRFTRRGEFRGAATNDNKLGPAD